MNEVRVFDPQGNLKKIFSPAELVAIGDEQFKKKERGAAYSGLFRRKPKKLKEKVGQ